MNWSARYVLIFLSGLLVFSMACSLLGNAKEELETVVEDIAETAVEAMPDEEMNEEVMSEDEEAQADDETVEDSEFPMPSGANNVMNISGTVNYQVEMSLDEVMEFYRTELNAKGLTERDILTVVSDGTFSMVFDGASNGMPIVVQGVDLGDGTSNINIRYEDI